MAPRSSLPTSSKKRKGDAVEDELYASIQQFEEQLVAAASSSKSSLNPLADLLDIAVNATDAQALSKAVYALYRVFVVIITNGLLLNVAGNDEARAVRAWIQVKLNAYTRLLTGLLKDEDSTVKVRTIKYHPIL